MPFSFDRTSGLSSASEKCLGEFLESHLNRVGTVENCGSSRFVWKGFVVVMFRRRGQWSE